MGLMMNLNNEPLYTIAVYYQWQRMAITKKIAEQLTVSQERAMLGVSLGHIISNTEIRKKTVGGTHGKAEGGKMAIQSGILETSRNEKKTKKPRKR